MGEDSRYLPARTIDGVGLMLAGVEYSPWQWEQPPWTAADELRFPPEVVAAMRNRNGDGRNGVVSGFIRHYCYERDHWLCVRCGNAAADASAPGGKRILTLDHIIPRRDGGTSHPDNLRTLCWGCHNALNQGKWS